jgi:predicted Rossmann fold flavoprotein
MKNEFDVIIIGAGAAGLMTAAQATKRGKTVLLIESNKSPGRKIIISGGGRCNFTNLEVDASFYVSQNKHFVKSALKQYTNWDFIDLVCQHDIKYHEKTLGQLFCNTSSKEILNMLLKEIGPTADIKCDERVSEVIKNELYEVKTNRDIYTAKSLVVASGGLSMPKMGASDIGYKIARQFGHKVIETNPALVPFTADEDLKKEFSTISGVSVLANVYSGDKSFNENILFTHRGLSGPAILKASLYWKNREKVKINFMPIADIQDIVRGAGKKILSNALKEHLPARFIETWVGQIPRILNKKGSEISNKEITELREILHEYEFIPSGTEGYRKAEVTRGGVSTDHVSSKTMESKLSPGLFFIGEVLDITGLLGGYNFQWAWSSGHVAAQNV